MASESGVANAAARPQTLEQSRAETKHARFSTGSSNVRGNPAMPGRLPARARSARWSPWWACQ